MKKELQSKDLRIGNLFIEKNRQEIIEIVWGRYIVYNFLNQNGMTLSAIGRMFPGQKSGAKKDHATVLSGCRRYKLMHGNKQWIEFNALCNELEPLLFDCYINNTEQLYSSLTPLELSILRCKNLVKLQTIKQGIIEKANLALSKSGPTQDNTFLFGY